jgi:hypothetical protein
MICNQANKGRNTNALPVPLLLRPFEARVGHKADGTEDGFLSGIELGLVAEFCGGRAEFGGLFAVGTGLDVPVAIVVVVVAAGGRVCELGLFGGEGDAEEVVAASHRRHVLRRSAGRCPHWQSPHFSATA